MVRDFTDYGILIDANDMDGPAREHPFQLERCRRRRSGRAVPGSSQGRGEACVWIGNPGSVERVRIRVCAVDGLVDRHGSDRPHVAEIDVDQTRVGVYMEHFTRRSTFERLRIGRAFGSG